MKSMYGIFNFGKKGISVEITEQNRITNLICNLTRQCAVAVITKERFCHSKDRTLNLAESLCREAVRFVSDFTLLQLQTHCVVSCPGNEISVKISLIRRTINEQIHWLCYL